MTGFLLLLAYLRPFPKGSWMSDTSVSLLSAGHNHLGQHSSCSCPYLSLPHSSFCQLEGKEGVCSNWPEPPHILFESMGNWDLGLWFYKNTDIPLRFNIYTHYTVQMLEIIQNESEQVSGGARFIFGNKCYW